MHDPENDRLTAYFSIQKESPDELLKKLERDIRKTRGFRLPKLDPSKARWVLFSIGLCAIVMGLFAASKKIDPRRVDNITTDKLWEYKTLAAVISSPAIADIDNDGVNEILVTSTDGKFYSLEGMSGRRIFFFETWHPIISSPVTSRPNARERWIVIAGEDRKVYTLSGNTFYGRTGTARAAFGSSGSGKSGNADNSVSGYGSSGTGNGRCLWATIPQTIDTPIHSTPVLLRINSDAIPDIVVAGEDGKMYALDGNRGWLIWRSQETMGKFFSTPLAVRVNEDVTPDLVVGSPEHRVYGIDGRNGQKIWETAVKGPVNSSAILLNEDRIVVGDEDGWLYSLDVKTGRIRNRLFLGSSVISTPAVLNRSVKPLLCVPLKNGSIRTVDAASFKPVWTYDSGFQDAFVATPAVFDLNNDRCDDLVITSRNGNCYLLNGRDGRDFCDPFFCGNSISSSPALADINGDGYLDIVFGSENGSVYALTIKTVPDRLVKRNRIVRGSFLDNGPVGL